MTQASPELEELGDFSDFVETRADMVGCLDVFYALFSLTRLRFFATSHPTAQRATSPTATPSSTPFPNTSKLWSIRRVSILLEAVGLSDLLCSSSY